METNEIGVLKARLASYINAVTFWRKSCEEAQAKIQRLEKLFADANRRAYEAEQARDAAVAAAPDHIGGVTEMVAPDKPQYAALAPDANLTA